MRRRPFEFDALIPQERLKILYPRPVAVHLLRRQTPIQAVSCQQPRRLTDIPLHRV